MKFRTYLLALGLMLLSFVLSGCYTQLARQTQDEDEGVAEQAVQEDGMVTEEYTEESSEYTGYQEDQREVTNIYVYDYYRPYYWDPWDPWYYSWYYRHHPRSRFYLSVGWGAYYDYWDWCGTRWSGYWDPWYRDRYWWAPTAVYYPGWYYPDYSPVYDPPQPNKKRDFGRRGARGSDDDGTAPDRRGSIGKPIADRTSISKPGDTVFDRGADGSYRRQRRTDSGTKDATTPASDARTTDRRRVSRRAADTDRATDTVTTPASGNDKTYTAPATSKNPTSVSKPKSTTRREAVKRNDGRRTSTVKKPSTTTRKVAPARESSRRSSGSSSSPSWNRGGSSGSSSAAKGSSSSGSSSSGSKSSGSSSRRDKN